MVRLSLSLALVLLSGCAGPRVRWEATPSPATVQLVLTLPPGAAVGVEADDFARVMPWLARDILRPRPSSRQVVRASFTSPERDPELIHGPEVLRGYWKWCAEQRAQGDCLAALLPRLDRPPPGVKADEPRWCEYVDYCQRRWEELTGRRPPARRGPDGRIRPPQTWEAYKDMRGGFERGREYETGRAAWYRAQGGLPVEHRASLRESRKPLVVRNPGVIPLELTAEESSVRYPDLCALEQDVPPGQLPRLETWSFKSIDLTRMPKNWRAEITAHARFAKKYYGGVLDLRRPGLRLRGKGLPVARVHLILDARFKPNAEKLEEILQELAEKTGVEVQFE